ncbi:hypothetical protein FIBSPDRAFT_847963 [Athelia psychrophila]|uniref:Uncharacterized protein n=1 Tax=Athelia psychrophila TaxID=1759441 RepID=A0A166W297_9AGAM|nr:hypothetical protein FIBSPDRAFT_847963 [Fibularhizoctonia sp. CBS 109695]
MTMNDFMVALLRIDRPDAVFRLWDYMEVLYNVKPDSHSLDTLCRAARQAVKIDSNTFKGNIAMLGLSNPFLQPKAEPATREEMVRAMHAALSDHDHRKARSIWKGAPACDGVRTVFRELILGNWPSMRDVRAPAHAVRRPAEDDGPFAPFREVAQSISQSVSSPSRHPQGQPQAARHTPPLLSLLPSARHASVVPSDDAFQAYILLQGTSSCQHEIALTLAWMRALQVEPTRRTLCFALIFWAEVSVRGPLFEEWAVKNGTSEYGRLVEWIADWVGAAKAPNDGMVAAYLQEVAQAKDTSPTRKTLRIRRSTGREGER